MRSEPRPLDRPAQREIRRGQLRFGNRYGGAGREQRGREHEHTASQHGVFSLDRRWSEGVEHVKRCLRAVERARHSRLFRPAPACPLRRHAPHPSRRIPCSIRGSAVSVGAQPFSLTNASGQHALQSGIRIASTGIASRRVVPCAAWGRRWADAGWALRIPARACGPCPNLCYDTYGDGYGSKWDNPQFGTGAVVTWSFMTPELACEHPSIANRAASTRGSAIPRGTSAARSTRSSAPARSMQPCGAR